jgi:hypothetical protein
MLLRDEDLEKFIAVYKDDTGEKLSTEEAREIAGRLIELYSLLARPLPGEIEAPAKKPSEDPPSLPEAQQSYGEMLELPR